VTPGGASHGYVRLTSDVDQLKTQTAEGLRLTDARFRSLDEHIAESKDLIVAGCDR
jgi:hypothetical protein